MPLGYLSARSTKSGSGHHLWLNNGTWWAHYTLHFDHRKRRIRRPLKTRSLDEAIRRRDELFARIARDGEWVEERDGRMPDTTPTISRGDGAGVARDDEPSRPPSARSPPGPRGSGPRAVPPRSPRPSATAA